MEEDKGEAENLAQRFRGNSTTVAKSDGILQPTDLPPLHHPRHIRTHNFMLLLMQTGIPSVQPSPCSPTEPPCVCVCVLHHDDVMFLKMRVTDAPVKWQNQGTCWRPLEAAATPYGGMCALSGAKAKPWLLSAVCLFALRQGQRERCATKANLNAAVVR